MKKLSPADLKKHVEIQSSQKAVLKDIKFVENGVEVIGQIYVKKISYEHTRDIDKSFSWKPNPDDETMLQLSDVDEVQLRATQVFATVCVDEDGTPFFESLEQTVTSYIEMIKAMWLVSNEVNFFVGKSLTKNSKKTKSTQNSRSKASAETASNSSETASADGNTTTGVNTDDDAEA